MEDNYLWDGSGEPDPQIQELEQILGKLRYQPQPLEIPSDLRVGRRWSSYSAMAIAASIGLCAALIGLWFYLQSDQVKPTQARTIPSMNQQIATPAMSTFPEQVAPAQDRETSRTLVAVNKIRRSRPTIHEPELTPQELAEKEQVIAALRLVSAKLNLAQRKTTSAPLNSIRNQHRIG